MEENKEKVIEETTKVKKSGSGSNKFYIIIIILLILGFGVYICYDQGLFLGKDSNKETEKKTPVKTDNKKESLDTKNETTEEDETIDKEYEGNNLSVYRYSFNDAKNSCVSLNPDNIEYGANGNGYVVYVTDINIGGKKYKLGYGNDYDKQLRINTLNGKNIEGYGTNTTEMLPLNLCVYGKYIIIETGWEGKYTSVISTDGKLVTGFGGEYKIIGNNTIHVEERDCSYDVNSGKTANSFNEFDINFNSDKLEKLNLKQSFFNCNDLP